MNKNFFFFLLLLLFTYISSCKKDEVQITSSNLSIQSLTMLDQTRYDGKVLLQSAEVIDGSDLQANLAGGSFSGVFYDANNEYVSAGTIKVNDDIHLKPVENGKRNLLSNISTFDLLGKQNRITFTSSSSDFKSFEDNIYFPKKLLVKTNMDSYEFLENNKDFKISWQSDAANQDGKIYLTICAAGKPCKLIEIDDNLGTYTVDSSELSFLESGDKVFLYIFRGNFKKVKVQQKNILVGAYLYANMSGIIVK